MTKLLYIKASPRPESRSVAVADAYLAALKAKMPGFSVDVMALWDETLPEFDGDRANAKLAVITGQQHSAIQKTKWDGVIAIVERFKAADIYLFAVPMWNGGIPYRLKQYIDIVHQPGHLWGLDPATGYFGLLQNKKAVLAYTSGAYGPTAPSQPSGPIITRHICATGSIRLASPTSPKSATSPRCSILTARRPSRA
jgi:FMN-dependent NADH-azoreductase